MDNLFPWNLGERRRSFPNAFSMAIIVAVLNTINLAVYTATIVIVTAELWKSVG